MDLNERGCAQAETCRALKVRHTECDTLNCGMRVVDAERNMRALNKRTQSQLEFSLSGAQAELTGDSSFPTLKEVGTVLGPIASGGLNTL